MISNSEIQTTEESMNVKLSYLSIDELRTYISLTEDEEIAIDAMKDVFPLKISRHYAELIKDSEPNDPLRRMIIPTTEELKKYDDDDELDIHADEAKYQPVQGIIHRYPGKVLLFPTIDCLGYCRFCYRSGQSVKALLSNEKLELAFSYIEENNIRDIVITGGDPLMMPVDHIDYILKSLRKIKSVEIIRFGTRALSYAPQIITEELVSVLSKYKPVYVKNSFIHPREIISITEKKLALLSDAGIVLLQQGPLLKGVNNSPEILKELYEKLVKNRVIPYYLGYGTVTPGTRHFTVYREEAKSIIDALENKTSGFCIPTLLTLDSSNNKTRKMN